MADITITMDGDGRRIAHCHGCHHIAEHAAQGHFVGTVVIDHADYSLPSYIERCTCLVPTPEQAQVVPPLPTETITVNNLPLVLPIISRA